MLTRNITSTPSTNPNFYQQFKETVVTMFGIFGAMIILIFVGILFAGPGYYLIMKERHIAKNTDKTPNRIKETIGWILLVIGIIILLPFIIDVLFRYAFDSLLDSFNE